MRRITKFEKNMFFVLVLMCPAIAAGVLTAKVNGSLLIYAVVALIGAVIWRGWIFVKDLRSRHRQRSEL
jgi:membrane protein implicated in regulation of membrane protease activity